MEMPETNEPDRGQARAWFDALEPMPQAFALAEIERAPRIMAVAGLVTRGITPEEARTLVLSGAVKRAPTNQSGDASFCGIVVLDPDTGFPVQLQTRPL